MIDVKLWPSAATVIRSVLVPAAMQLLGDRNWYLPRRLEWLPHVELERER